MTHSAVVVVLEGDGDVVEDAHAGGGVGCLAQQAGAQALVEGAKAARLDDLASDSKLHRKIKACITSVTTVMRNWCKSYLDLAIESRRWR